MRRQIIIASFLCLTIVFCGCKKSIQQKLVGTWEMVSFDTNPAPYVSFTFLDGDMLIWKKTDINDVSITDTAYYFLESKIYKYYLKISRFDVRGGSPDGKWIINEISDKVLKITRIEMPNGESPYYRYEFLKK